MTTPPFMKLYWGDYHRGTRHLRTAAEHGAYMLLIGALWDAGGSLPADDDLLARSALLSAEEWADLRPILMPFFKVSRGRLTHERVSEELAKYDDTICKRKLAGKAGGEARSRNHTENPLASAKQTPSESHHNQNQNQSQKEDSSPTPPPLLRLVPPQDPPAPPQPAAKLERADRAQTGSRLPADWRPGDDDRSYAAQLGFGHDAISRIGEVFRDYWVAQAGAKGRKADWPATWRNWVRREAERNPPRRPQTSVEWQ